MFFFTSFSLVAVSFLGYLVLVGFILGLLGLLCGVIGCRGGIR